MLLPNWPIQGKVGALSTTRHGGNSDGAFSSFNLGFHVGDEASQVRLNHRCLEAYLPTKAVWLEQVHGSRVLEVTSQDIIEPWPQADAVYTRVRLQPLAIMTADCLPILLSCDQGLEVAAVHGGWRPLAQGILAKTLTKFIGQRSKVIAWLGPAIGPNAFEVGIEVKAQFCDADPAHSDDFKFLGGDKYLADIFAIATRQLNQLGVNEIYTDNICTVSDMEQFYSYRRDGQTGRMATLIWRN